MRVGVRDWDVGWDIRVVDVYGFFEFCFDGGFNGDCFGSS